MSRQIRGHIGKLEIDMVNNGNSFVIKVAFQISGEEKNYLVKKVLTGKHLGKKNKLRLDVCLTSRSRKIGV